MLPVDMDTVVITVSNSISLTYKRRFKYTRPHITSNIVYTTSSIVYITRSFVCITRIFVCITSSFLYVTSSCVHITSKMVYISSSLNRDNCLQLDLANLQNAASRTPRHYRHYNY